MQSILLSLLRDDQGQDLIEYALLTSFVALVGALSINLLSATIQTSYGTWDTNINGLWAPNDPAGGGS